MANNQITPFQLTDQFTMDNFNQRIDETNTALQNKIDASSVYTKEESISASTRTALGLAMNATPDAALAEIARQLSESGGFQMNLLWENASPQSTFVAQTIDIDGTNYTHYMVIPIGNNGDHRRGAAVLVEIGKSGILSMPEGWDGCTSGNLACFTRVFSTSKTSVNFETGASVKAGATYSSSDSYAIPVLIFGIKIGGLS